MGCCGRMAAEFELSLFFLQKGNGKNVSPALYFNCRALQKSPIWPMFILACRHNVAINFKHLVPRCGMVMVQSGLSLHSCFYNFLYLNWVCLKLRYIPSRLAISIGIIMMIHQHSGHRTFSENPFLWPDVEKHIDKPNNLRIHEPICELVSFSWRIPGVSLVWCSRRIFTQQYCIVHWQSHDQKLAWTRPNTLHHVKKPDRHCCVTTGQLHDITCTIWVATFGYWMFAD